MIELRASKVEFFSNLDEKYFMEWLHSIPSVTDTFGEIADIVIIISETEIVDDDLRELIALFYRFRIDSKQLSKFLSTKNRGWFHQPGMFWFSEVFPQER